MAKRYRGYEHTTYHSSDISSDSPDVEFCGYSMPHPTTHQINVRVQTTGMEVPLAAPAALIRTVGAGRPASQALADSLDMLASMCEHAQNVYEEAIASCDS
jgi:DNA-directed RNA polymerase I and III subunit RPAC2